MSNDDFYEDDEDPEFIDAIFRSGLKWLTLPGPSVIGPREIVMNGEQVRRVLDRLDGDDAVAGS